jgi:uncharacterized membrane protein YfcA
MDPVVIVSLVFFCIALIYSSVGFGGGSSYLAVLALFSFGSDEMRFIALVCNCVVVTGSLLNFYRAGLLDLKASLPFILFSIPFAFLGGYMKLEESIYFIILGLLLISVALLMIFRHRLYKKAKHRDDSVIRNSAIGSGIGFLSGLVGIGGGIFLSPILHVVKWSRPKVIAATCSLFILVNSLAGLIGQSFNRPAVEFKLIFWLVIAVFVGGQIGNRLAIKKLKPEHVKLITAILVLYVGIRILIKYL